ncbi:MAG: transposase [Melioribacteraceae bacterium]|nr:transposase [Melioribacteraceae bacterium]
MKHSEITHKNLNWFKKETIEIQISLFNNQLELMKLIANQLFEDEVHQKAGEKYERESDQYSRWGSNPGSIKVGESRIKMQIPRLLNKETKKTESLSTYGKLREIETPSEELIKKVLYGLSQKNYGEVSKLGAESFGLSQSSISRRFIEESKKAIEEFEQRDLSNYDFIGLAIDGKYLKKRQVVIALGITTNGEKIPLGFIETTTENSTSIKGLLSNLIKRNFRFIEGILVIVDGATGLKKAVKETFGDYAIIQRCVWHKRENVVSYLPKEIQNTFRGKLQRAYSEPDYETAKRKLYETRIELEKINRSAANSLDEGLEETLTLHKLGLVEELGKSLMTSNIIENLNSQLGAYIKKVKHWSTSDMRARWVAASLLQIEQRMRRINNYEKLNLLRSAIKSQLKLEQEMVV